MRLNETRPVTIELTPADVDVLAEGFQLPRDLRSEIPIQEVPPQYLAHAEYVGQQVLAIHQTLSSNSTAESGTNNGDEVHAIQFGGYVAVAALFGAWALRVHKQAATTRDKARYTQGNNLIEELEVVMRSPRLEELEHVRVIPNHVDTQRTTTDTSDLLSRIDDLVE